MLWNSCSINYCINHWLQIYRPVLDFCSGLPPSSSEQSPPQSSPSQRLDYLHSCQNQTSTSTTQSTVINHYWQESRQCMTFCTCTYMYLYKKGSWYTDVSAVLTFLDWGEGGGTKVWVLYSPIWIGWFIHRCECCTHLLGRGRYIGATVRKGGIGGLDWGESGST